MRRTIDAAVEQARSVVARLRGSGLTSDSKGGQLSEIAVALGQLAASAAWRGSSVRPALPGEELLHSLAVADDGPSLYLVSDGAGVVSTAHDHGTWVIIAGIRGREANFLYTVTDAERRLAKLSERSVVGAGDTLVLAPTSIHSTEVEGLEATFHLHLYGRPLHLLPSFESRRYTVAAA